MPDLYQTLLKHDLGHIKIIADLWGLELESRDIDSAAEELSASLLDLETVSETLEILPAEARTAITALVESNGKMEWAIFARTYGEIREMGAGRRDRERPHLKPASIAENLFYRGLLSKAFFDASKGSQEFAYIPEDLLEIIEHTLQIEETEEEKEKIIPVTKDTLGRPATPVEKTFEIPASDHVLDDATTLLAALRLVKPDWQSDPKLHALLNSAKIIKKSVPQAEVVKSFLASSRAEALTLLHKAWLDSQTFNELHLISNLICEGEWSNDPLTTRRFIIDLLNSLPKDKWWSLPAFLRDLKAKHPDFQRPAGDYDSWYIKRASDGQFLRGFAYWDQVDGEVVKAIIQNMHWLGKIDLASAEEGGAITAFRLTPFSEKKDEKGKISVTSNGRITVTRLFSRAVRYQIARFCDWEDAGRATDEYKYQVTAQSLKHANEQGLKAEQLLTLLVKYTNGNVPPAFVKALKRWEEHGVEARVESLFVLRVSRPEVMEEMRDSKAGRFLGELLSPTAVVVKEGAIQKVMAALTELGLLAEVKDHE